jgi:alpha-N-arabinofuranosidase
LTDDVWATSSIDAVAVDTFQYVQLNGTIENNATAPDANNTFAITFDAEALRGQTLYFALFSLFPETFKSESFPLPQHIGLMPDT